MRSVLLRLAGFTLLPLLALVLPFLLLPIIARVVGAAGWSSITSGQAIGVIAATIILWSWNISGPVEIARAGASPVRAALYSSSMRSRMVIAAVVLPLMTVIVALVAHAGFRLDAITMAWATALTGFSPAWYGIGTGQPRILAVFDTFPRFCAAVLSAPLIVLTGQVWTYGAMSVLATLAALVSFHRKFGESGTWFPKSPRNVMREIIPDAGTAGINLTGSAYASSPVPIATATVPSATATAGFASADSIYRLGIFSVVALGNTFQGWTLERDAADPRQRHLIALAAHALLGVAGGLFLALFGPWVSGVMFGEAVRADTLTCVYYGLSFFFLSASTPLIRNLLIPARRQRTVLLWTGISAAAGVFLMIVAGLSSNVPAVALGMAVSEALLFLGLLAPAVRALPAVARPATVER
ncbi:polysaccharide biosynthesis protein [Arthrobacter sp. PAMC25564]|uniref:polysaccharide biosynthesis protein n=1 Tax=Arthrobacter sp. PAMC25564 TaxID=2565366 RepID=UPI0010A23D5A|nr:polysaccharide biosynthesis protein [Arthrobacter sp. PAMC25564]QCB96955.1 polysaccharide biosynthesis protein [Arthrobacter sp. PAMC25564]